MTSGPSIVILADPEAVAAAAAEDIATTLATAVARGVGPISARPAARRRPVLSPTRRSPLREQVPWDAVDIWFGDDRFVPRDHPLSNVLLVDQVLLRAAAYTGQSGGGDSGVDIEQLRPRRHPAGLSRPCVPLRAGHRRGTRGGLVRGGVRRAGPGPRPARRRRLAGLRPLFLGIGPDGHLLSVFPGSPALTSRELALAIPAPTHVEPHVERVTLNPAVVAAAHGSSSSSTARRRRRSSARSSGDPRPRPLARPARAPRRCDVDPRSRGCGRPAGGHRLSASASRA